MIDFVPQLVIIFFINPIFEGIFCTIVFFTNVITTTFFMKSGKISFLLPQFIIRLYLFPNILISSSKLNV